MRSGDPVLILTCLGFGDGDWQEISDLSLDDLAVLAEGAEPVKRVAGASNEELHAAIIDSLPRVA